MLLFYFSALVSQFEGRRRGEEERGGGREGRGRRGGEERGVKGGGEGKGEERRGTNECCRSRRSVVERTLCMCCSNSCCLPVLGGGANIWFLDPHNPAKPCH